MHRGENNRRRYAVQLCTLRKYGRFLDSYNRVPAKVLGYLSRQLEIEPILTLSGPSREATEAEYRSDIRRYLGYVQFNEQGKQHLERWILDAVCRSFYVEDLIDKAERFLKDRKIVIPPSDYLERMVNSAYARAERKIFKTIYGQIPDRIKQVIDHLLQADPNTGTTPFFRFGEYPPEATARKIAYYFRNYEELVAIQISMEFFAGIHPGLIKKLGTAVKSYDAWRIRRFDDVKRYALASCYLMETHQSVVDNLVDMHAQFLTDMERKTKNIYEHAHRKLRKRLRRGIPTLEAFATTALALEKHEHIDMLYRENDRERVESAVEDSKAFRRLEERGYLEILHGKYPNFKRYFPLFLKLEFQASRGARYLIEAIEIARKFNSGVLKKLPIDIPTRFIPKRWKKMLHTQDGRINPRTWELALALAMREALKSGDLFLPAGRHYVSFWNLVYDDQKWAAEKTKVCADQGFSLDPGHILKHLADEFDRTATTAVSGVGRNSFIKVKNGKVRFSKDKADGKRGEVKKLRQLIEASLPKIRIEHLLMEVEALCGFSTELRPVEGPLGDITEKLPVLLAAIVAHGTNLGVFTMADSTTKITVDMLRNISNACLRQETLKAANTVLVNYQKNLEVSSVWGHGHASSSDGQRFGVSRSSLIASVYPRYFGYYDRVVTVYTHVSDLLSVFNTLVISCGQREALYVLNGLLENDSELSPSRHHTDTGGYTDHLFALCFLLGFSFMPRIKSLHKRRLYKIDPNLHYDPLEPLFSGTVNIELIREQWESLIRVAASLKNRIVTADVIVKRLVNSSPADRLSRALTELGRLVKTVYILSYIQDEEMRRQVQKQLNRGEHRQGVARHVFFADQGEFRSGDLAEIMNKASCLSLLSNAILVWNTVHISEIVTRLRERGHTISDKHLAGVSPMLRKHVIVNGTYDFTGWRQKPARIR